MSLCTRYFTTYQVFDWLVAIGGVGNFVSFSNSDYVDDLAGRVTMYFTWSIERREIAENNAFEI